MTASASPVPARQGIRPFARTMLVYLPIQVVPALVGAAAMPALGWFLAPAEFATLALVTAALPFAAVAADWIAAGYQRSAHLNDEIEAQAAVWVLVLGGAVSALVAAGGILSGQFTVVAVALLAVPYMVIRIQWIKLQMTGRAGTYSLLQTLYTVVRAACMVATAALTHRALAPLASWIAVSFATVMIGPRMRVERVPRTPALIGLARIGVPLVSASMAINIAAIADRFIVATLQGREAAGVYTLGYLLTEGVLSIPASVAYLAFCRFAVQSWDAGRERQTLLSIAALLRIQVPLAIGCAVAVALAGPAALRVIAPVEYQAAAPVLGLVAIAQVPAGVVPYLILVATLRRQTVRAVIPSAVVSVASVALTIPAVYFAGLGGAAAATLATYLLYALLLARAVFGCMPGPRVIGLLLAAVAATAGIAVSHSALLRIALGAVALALTACATTGSWWKHALGRTT